MAIDIGPKRKIYRGGVEVNTPQLLELPAAAAGIKAGNIVVRTATTLANGTAATAAYFYIANAPMHQNTLTYSYASGEMVQAYIPRSRDVYLVRVAAAQTLAADSPLAADAAGRVRLGVVGTDPIIGYSVFASVTAAVDTLIDMRIK
ncbi:hypothetical protein D3C77_48730 [compost metagenome]